MSAAYVAPQKQQTVSTILLYILYWMLNYLLERSTGLFIADAVGGHVDLTSLPELWV